MTNNRRSLTEEQRLQVAYAVIFHGIHQHVMASVFGVNPGRVAEAVTSVRASLTDETVNSYKSNGDL